MDEAFDKISVENIAFVLSEGEAYVRNRNLEKALNNFQIASTLIKELDTKTGRKIRVGSSLAGVSIVEIIDFMRGGADHHPVLGILFGGLGGILREGGGEGVLRQPDAASGPRSSRTG